MLQWAVGYCSSDKSLVCTKQPKDGHLVTTNVWTVGSPKVQTASNSHTTVTIIGDCYITEKELQDVLYCAERDEWYELVRWPGIYSVTVRRKDITFVLGSLSGTSRIHYTTTREGAWWATASTPLAALLSVEVDLSRIVLESAVDGIEPYGGKAPYPGVKLVAPGSLLRLTRGNHPSIVRWYEPTQHLSFEDAAAQFHGAFHRSIDRRAKESSPISTEFSGGLDSGTITRLLDRQREIQGVTYVDRWIEGDDEMYARQLAAGLLNMRHVVLEGGDDEVQSSQLGIVSDVLTDLPSLDASLVGRNKAMLEAARVYGAQHYFTGEGGDNVLDPGKNHIADLYLAGRHAQARKMAARYARYRMTAPRAVKRVLRQTVRTSYAQALRELAGEMLSVRVDNEPLAVHWCSAYDISWWTEKAKKAVAGQLLQLAEETSEVLPPAILHGWQGVRRVAQGRTLTQELARSMGMTFHIPFLDTEVVHVGFSMPSYLHVQEGRFKPLLSAAFAGELPELLLQRTTKTVFNGSTYRGIKINQAVIREMIESSRLAEAGMVDSQDLLRVLERATLGLKIPTGHFRSFMSTELWLANLDLRKETWWGPREISS